MGGEEEIPLEKATVKEEATNPATGERPGGRENLCFFFLLPC